MEKILTLFLSALLSLNLAAQTAEQRGLEIATEVEALDSGWSDQIADMTMILRNRQGEESTREIRTFSLEVADDGDKSMTIFDEPRDIKGTAFLSWTHAREPDDQWLYLPALKRVKRISSRNKSGPFMGSEFAYEDLSSQEIEKYDYKFVRDESLDTRDTHVIERYPAYEHSGYTRQVVWIDKQMMRPVKIEFYDRKDALLKTLQVRDFTQYADRYWRPAEMHVENHQTGKSTTLYWSNYQFSTGLDERDFDQSSLKRAR